MAARQQIAASISAVNLRLRIASLISLSAILMIAHLAHGQTLTVLHNFTNQSDGGTPVAGVTFDQQGRIYGTAASGGSHQDGVVYRLVREGEGRIFSPLYSFGSQEHDGANPYARVLFGPDGLLYGTTYNGGAEDSGTVFSLRPPATACKTALCPWLETVLYNFTGGADGAGPAYGDLAFDQDGNIYGTTVGGGSGWGVVFKLTRSGSGWTESVLWNFTGGSDGGLPFGGVISDNAGNLYGTTNSGGTNESGTVYELSPTQSGWSETTLYSFTGEYGDGAGSLIMDAHGNLFGIAGSFFNPSSGAYELTPQNGTWSFTLLQSFENEYTGPVAAPAFDSQGNLYGPLPTDGSDGEGEIFKLTPSGNQWIYSPFYQFSFSGNSGVEPIGAVTFDTNGNMYGTASSGGTGGYGTVWEITP
jgi:uncharacterized repeat protein (TIGR03803 family)